MDSRIGISKICSTECALKAKIQKEIPKKNVTIEMNKAVFAIGIFRIWKHIRVYLIREILLKEEKRNTLYIIH